MQKEAGFSLMELVVIIVILAVISAMAYPQFSDYMKNATCREVASSLSSQLREARSRAISMNREHHLNVQIGNGRYRIEQRNDLGNWVSVNEWTSVPNNVALRGNLACDDNADLTIEFNPNGTANNRRICVMSNEGGGLVAKRHVGVSSVITGKVYNEKP